ncbi:AraC family transcriptional regulator [Pedobacter agri]|uniref:helix-turn-helix domain-containing protein n=1 Tax=Pedobacter TaxID=84567 RepID=UPI00292F7EC8|nr:AraC family transcriptional regulator [Pedobacter agri]
MNNGIYYKQIKPDYSLSDFVESFWVLHNDSENDKVTVGLPDGRIDLFFIQSEGQPFKIVLLGLGTQYHDKGLIPAKSLRFAVSFKLLAVEYVFHESISDIVDKGKLLAHDFWDINLQDIHNFESFCESLSQKIKSRITKEIDIRKKSLFDHIHEMHGSITVKELSEKVKWSSRQMNRYFNQQFGISLKLFCNLLRFRASLEHIARGKLYPELDFTDQNHFIKEIKKFSGVVPKELFKNKNDRFILLSSLSTA